MREAAKRACANGGRITSLSSGVVGLYQSTYGVYAATKAGVEAMTHVLANEMRGRGITVNAVTNHLRVFRRRHGGTAGRVSILASSSAHSAGLSVESNASRPQQALGLAYRSEAAQGVPVFPDHLPRQS